MFDPPNFSATEALASLLGLPAVVDCINVPICTLVPGIEMVAVSSEPAPR